MEGLQPLAVEAYVEAMRGPYEQVMREVAAAVNAAPSGRVIRDSEEAVRDLLGRFRTQAYEKALQMRIDATEASFSPGGRGGSAGAEQGTGGTGLGDDQRGAAVAAAALP
jgi:hypothetical protein